MSSRSKRKHAQEREPRSRRERAAAAASMLQFDRWLVEANETISRALTQDRDAYNNAMRDDLLAASIIRQPGETDEEFRGRIRVMRRGQL